MATTTVPEVTKKTAPVTLTANAVTKVKEIMGQQNPVPAGLAHRRGGRRMLRLLLFDAV